MCYVLNLWERFSIQKHVLPFRVVLLRGLERFSEQIWAEDVTELEK